jgi:hypothetical protein
MKTLFKIYTNVVFAYVIFNWLLNGNLFRVGYNVPSWKIGFFFASYVLIGFLTLVKEMDSVEGKRK